MSLIICALDIGVHNPARTVIEIAGNSIRVLSISKLDWSVNWEDVVLRDVACVGADIVLIERQCPRSPNLKFVYYIKGFLYGNTKVLLRNPPIRGGNYRYRKQKSSVLFKKMLHFFNIDQSFLQDHDKIDDIADSFLIAVKYVLGNNNRN